MYILIESDESNGMCFAANARVFDSTTVCVKNSLDPRLS